MYLCTIKRNEFQFFQIELNSTRNVLKLSRTSYTVVVGKTFAALL